MALTFAQRQARWRKRRGEYVRGLEQLVSELDEEITKLKAEVARLRTVQTTQIKQNYRYRRLGEED